VTDPDGYLAADEQPPTACNPDGTPEPAPELERELPTQQAAEYISDQLAILVSPPPGKT